LLFRALRGCASADLPALEWHGVPFQGANQLALGLRFFQSQHGGTEWHYLMAASTLAALPIIILFFFTQKTFIEGISMIGIKG